MQGYTYSIFSLVAIAIHLIINFDLLFKGSGVVTERGRRYRGFLLGVLFYYVADGAWGVIAGLGWTRLLYADSILFFLSMPVFVFAWCRFVNVYLGLGKRVVRFLTWYGCGLLAFNVAMLAENFVNGCIFDFDEQGKYLFGGQRYLPFSLLVLFNAMIGAAVLAKALKSRDAERRRGLMVFMFDVIVAAAMALQIILPLTPYTSLGCLVGICFFHVFVIQDEQAARHMAELENALERARTAEKSRSMFFSIVSHDIRTPLNAILGYSELLQDGIADSAEKEEALKSIRASGTTLLQLVNDVLDLAKMDAGKMALHPEPVLLSRLADDVFASFRLAASDKGVGLVNGAVNVPAVRLDGHRFRQILFNLVGNAVKFTERGTVTVAASYSGGTLEVSVSDTGCGIAPDMVARVLDPFVQVQDLSHSAERTGGTGLGLSICRSLSKAMGGELLVESELGKGSTFRVVIPGVATCATEDEPVAKAKTSGVTRDFPKRVLVVDDSPVNRSVLAAFLKRLDVASTGQARDGAEALAALDSAMKAGKPYDFVFSDFWMPNMNGLEFVEQLRDDPRFSRLPVFAVTADTEFQSDDRSKLFNGILLKPLTSGKLAEVFAAFTP